MMRHPVTGKDKSSFGVIAHQVLENIYYPMHDWFLFILTG